VNFYNIKLIYIISCFLLFLAILSPTLMMFASFSQDAIPIPLDGEFSELWILGSDNMTEDYPFAVSEDKSYKISLGVGNYLGELGYYAIRVKLRNQLDPAVNPFAGLPSPLQSLFEYRVFLDNNETWVKEFSFSFERVDFNANDSRISRLAIDGYSIPVDKVSVWDAHNSGFFYQLFFELWIYNETSLAFDFHNRSVGVWLNMSSSL
jgi:hypothetical protein